MIKTTPAWFVLTGGPSTGKTSLLSELERAGYKTVQEAARVVIDEAVAAGRTVADLRKDERAFQDEVLTRKINIEQTLNPNEITVFDRGMHDSLAYLRHYNYELDKCLIDACKRSRYAKVFLLAPLDKYVADYARTEDSAFAAGIHQLLHDAYAEHGMEPIIVPDIGLKARTAFITEHLQRAN